MAHIVLKPTSPDRSEVVIAESPCIIGRHHAGLALPADAPEAARLSRRHACIFHEAGVPYLVDLRSRYGSTRNGKPVAETPVRLRHGDEICFAGCLGYKVAIRDDDAAITRIDDPAVRLVLEPCWKGLRLDPIVVTKFPFLVDRTDQILSGCKQRARSDVDFISRYHALIYLKNGAVYLEDLGSTNGTFVGGRRLQESAELLGEDDVVAFGSDDLKFIVHLGQQTEGSGGKTRIYARDDTRVSNEPGPATLDIGTARSAPGRRSAHARRKDSGKRRKILCGLAAGLALLGLAVPFGAYTIGSADGWKRVFADEPPHVDYRAALQEMNARLEEGNKELQRQVRKIERLQREVSGHHPHIGETGPQQTTGPVATQRSPAEAPPAEPAALPPESFGTYHALVIGSDMYRYLPRLDTAVNDARAVAEILSRRYGFETTTLFNADRYQILSSLNGLRGRLTDKDNLVIYYAGHGELDEINRRGHWLPIDAERDSSANWISNAEVTDILNAMSAKHVLLIADSCYSGALTRASPGFRLAGGMSDRQRQSWIRVMVDRRSRIALTSGGLEPVVDAGEERHSVFAKALLEALARNTGVLDSQSLFAEISAQVTYAASRYEVTQVPEYAPIRSAGHDGGEFFFVPHESGTELKGRR